MPVRCHQCKTRLGGRGTGKAHAKLTGHVWKPGYYCEFCEATFTAYCSCRAHRLICDKKVPPGHPPTFTTATKTSVQSSQANGTARNVSAMKKPKPPTVYKCSNCRLKLSSNAALSEHATACERCEVCACCVRRGSLEQHYRESVYHPTPCPWCNRGFSRFSELPQHYETCMPRTPAVAIVTPVKKRKKGKAAKKKNISAWGGLQKLLPEPSTAPAGEADSERQPQNDTLEGREEIATPRGLPLALASGPQENASSSPMYGDTDSHTRDGMPSNELPSVAPPIDCEVLARTTETSAPDATSSMNTPSLAQTLESDKSGGDVVTLPAPEPPRRPAPTKSFHCESCVRSACTEPMSTVCGHVFCRSCLIRELEAHGTCPVCHKIFFLKLDVGDPC
ncbi:hypothetical protein C8Q77DRAFT_1092666 [Trametes polyzona]|nr:hypothetical protein C8Q77DRAFT_1092666 [Trametes polyzona]